MKGRNIVYIAILFCLLATAGCGTTKVQKDYLIEKVDEKKFEYIANIVVYREGYNFLWLLPVGGSTENDFVLETMWKSTKKAYPDAVGLYDVKEVHREGMSLVNWSPSVALWGKIMKKKQ